MPFIGLSPETTYATKLNLKFPGTSAQATAAETVAQNRMNDALPSAVTVTVAGGAIPVAS